MMNESTNLDGFSPSGRDVDVVLCGVEDVCDAELDEVLEVLDGGAGPDDDARVHLVAVHTHPHSVCVG